eukprot:3203376-Prymnesium_polylepis.1
MSSGTALAVPNLRSGRVKGDVRPTLMLKVWATWTIHPTPPPNALGAILHQSSHEKVEPRHLL